MKLIDTLSCSGVFGQSFHFSVTVCTILTLIFDAVNFTYLLRAVVLKIYILLLHVVIAVYLASIPVFHSSLLFSSRPIAILSRAIKTSK